VIFRPWGRRDNTGRRDDHDVGRSPTRARRNPGSRPAPSGSAAAGPPRPPRDRTVDSAEFCGFMRDVRGHPHLPVLGPGAERSTPPPAISLNRLPARGGLACPLRVERVQHIVRKPAMTYAWPNTNLANDSEIRECSQQVRRPRLAYLELPLDVPNGDDRICK